MRRMEAELIYAYQVNTKMGQMGVPHGRTVEAWMKTLDQLIE